MLESLNVLTKERRGIQRLKGLEVPRVCGFFVERDEGNANMSVRSQPKSIVNVGRAGKVVCGRAEGFFFCEAHLGPRCVGGGSVRRQKMRVSM